MSRFKGSSRTPLQTVVLTPAVEARRPGQAPASGAERVAAAVPSVEPAAASEPVRRFALYCAIAYIFVRLSFLHEVLAITAGLKSYLPTIFGSLTIIGVILTGGVQRTLRSKGANYWMCLALWLVLSTTFSSWRGGSYGIINAYFRNDFIMMFAVAGLVVAWKEFMWVFYAIAAAGLFNEVTIRWLGKIADNRLEGGVVTIGNANDFAAHMLLILPLLWRVGAWPTVVRPVRWLMKAAVAYGFYLTGSTASRGALLALIAMAIVVVAGSSGTQKMLAIVGSVAILIVLLALLPGAVLSRFSTLVTNDDRTATEADESSSERMRILKDSLNITLHHPLFGVGPGEFSDTNGFGAIAEGRTKDFSVTHNTYTQISSENGIPALIFFAGGLVAAIRSARDVRRRAARTNPAVASVAFTCLISMTGFFVATFFLSMGYHMYFPLLAGISMALTNAASRVLSASPPKPAYHA